MVDLGYYISNEFLQVLKFNGVIILDKKIMLIDGNSIMNRAFYALPVLTNKDGEYTNGIYGFLNIFFKFFDEEKPDYIVVAFDLPKPTFRHEKFVDYKGTRKAMPDELRPQFPILKALLNKMSIKIIEIEGFEADDVLGTIARKSEEDGLNTVIISGDKDLLQLCTEKIKVRIPKTKAGKTEVEDYLSKDVVEKIGVTPTEYIDMKALMGDTSDNIPGVPGIGEKTALKIIQQYKSIEKAIEDAENIKPPKTGEKLINFKEQAVLSKELATIFTEVPIDINYNEMTLNDMFNENAFEEMKRLDFRTHITRFKKPEPKEADFDIPEEWLHNTESNEDYLKKCMSAQEAAVYFAFDKKGFNGVSICINGEKAKFFTDIQEIKQFLESHIKKITHDYKRAAQYSKRNGIEFNNVIFDTMLAAYLVHADRGSYTQEEIGADYLNEIGQKPEILADSVLKAYPVLEGMLKENQLESLYYDIEFPLTETLMDMEQRGISVDKQGLIDYGKVLDEKIQSLTADIYSLADEQFNINSTQQLGVILFEKLGLKSVKKTKTGYSTAADVLEKLYFEHEIIPKISEYRTLSKLKSTYVEGLVGQIDETGKIHTTFNQTIASTGRLSSVDPNLQNIPIRLPVGRELRKVFVPSSGEYVFLDGDYSQIELRVLAHMSGDETLIEAFKSGQDIHRLTASQVFNTPFDQVTSEQRSNAKAVNFGIVYGIGSFSLGEDLHISKKEAQRYIDGYFEKYPKVKEYMENAVSNAAKDGYAKTLFGRKREIPELQAKNFNIRSFGERVAMNMPVQGSAADIIKIAMINVYKRLKKEGLESGVILQVHDELLLEVKKNEAEKARIILKEEMENCVKLSVPLLVDVHIGNNWYETK